MKAQKAFMVLRTSDGGEASAGSISSVGGKISWRCFFVLRTPYLSLHGRPYSSISEREKGSWRSRRGERFQLIEGSRGLMGYGSLRIIDP